jgi:nucleoside-diphosphate-sugar epimerase
MVLLTGSSGFLGHHIENLLIIKSFSYDTLNRKNGDYLVDLSSTIPQLDKSYDLIIHSAGTAHINPKSESDIRYMYDSNVNGVLNLLAALERNILPKEFVFISSVSVYGAISGNLIDETATLGAQDSYGKSKIECERILIKWCSQNNVKLTILRLPLIIGFNAPGNLGSMLHAILRGYYFNIRGNKARKSVVLASDIAELILSERDFGGIFNLTDGHHPLITELSNSFSIRLKGESLTTLPYNLVLILAKFGDLLGEYSPINSLKLKKLENTLTFSDAKARDLLKWSPKSVIKWIKEQ